MSEFRSQLRAAVVATALLFVLCGGVYPVFVDVVGQLAFPHQANGSLMKARDGTVIGSLLLGQAFTGARYFHPRPSAAGSGYDATNSGGSNLGPTSERLRDAVQRRVAAYRVENALPEGEPVPADAVTASGSGLDPHISPRNAEWQAGRVAQARGMSMDDVRRHIQWATEPRGLGFLGEPGVNVLKLNLALEGLGVGDGGPGLRLRGERTMVH